jgi:hypothetical protein
MKCQSGKLFDLDALFNDHENAHILSSPSSSDNPTDAAKMRYIRSEETLRIPDNGEDIRGFWHVFSVGLVWCDAEDKRRG